MIGDPVDVAAIYNDRLAASGSPLRWRYDDTGGLYLISTVKVENRWRTSEFEFLNRREPVDA